MKKPIMETKLVVKPVIGFLLHSDFWEGPCRAGRREDLQPEVEGLKANKKFKEMVTMLSDVTDQIEFLEPVMVPYMETLVVDEEIYGEIEKDVEKIDFFLMMNYRTPKLERYGKMIVTLSNGNEGADISAYCRSIGLEAYNAIDMRDLNEIAHRLWVRKAVSRTRALVLTQGSQPTYGVQSNIRDPETLRKNYGFEVVKVPFRDIFPLLEEIRDEEAEPIARKLLEGSKETKVNRDFFINDIKYYLAAKKMMDMYQCNAFSTSCIELCASRVPQEKKFVPCMTHTLLKGEGIPSGCEEDLNALMAMTVMQLTAMRPAFMGNPFVESDEIVKIHHAVPAMCMNGYGTEPLDYKLWSFTGQGFGAKAQIDFVENKENEITLGRFNPDGNAMCVKVGKIIRSEFVETYCSPYYYIQMEEAREFMHNLADFGHHQVLIFGDYMNELKKIAKLMNFKIVEG